MLLFLQVKPLYLSEACASEIKNYIFAIKGLAQNFDTMFKCCGLGQCTYLKKIALYGLCTSAKAITFRRHLHKTELTVVCHHRVGLVTSVQPKLSMPDLYSKFCQPNLACSSDLLYCHSMGAKNATVSPA